MICCDKSYDVIIVGAGLIGASFALLLAQRSNFKIAVVEKAAPIRVNQQPNQRVVALGQAARALLTEIDVFQTLGEEACHPYLQMFIWDESSDGELEFSANDHGHSVLGHMVDAVQCSWSLQKALQKNSQIDLYYNFAAESLQRHNDNAQISSGEYSLQAKLIVAADGNRSWVRQQVKIFADQRDYQQLGIVAKISTGKSHQDTAFQRFLQGGPIAVLPLANNQSSIVWSAPKSQADKLLLLPENELATAICRALDNRLGKVSLLSMPQAFPLKSQSAQGYFKRGVVLIGDAAHSIHPLAGQGANLGFKDATSLVEVLENCESRQLGELATLERYQRMRKVDNKQTDQMMSALHSAFGQKNPWWLMARGKGMNWLNKSQALKSILIKQAMGF